MERKADEYDFSNIEVEDGENFYGQKNMSKEQIILKSLQRCMDEGSKEMTEGGILRRVIDGKVYEVAVPNQKEIFINSIRMFWSVIFPLVIEKYKELCEEQLGNFTERYHSLVKEYETTQTEIRKDYRNKNNINLLRENINSLKSMFEERKMDLYREKLDFGILVIEKENWFGERYA